MSAVVAWEITNKVRTGKWPDAKLLAERFFDAIAHYGMVPLPIALEHAHRAGSLQGGHRDPFDRLLAAQALAEDIPVVTVDPAFQMFNVRVIW